MDYFFNFFDIMLDNYLNVIIVCGGDFNYFDFMRFKCIIGWIVLVDFLIWGDLFLDNCFINRLEFFGKVLFIKMLIKMDYIGFIVLVGKKFKFICKKV